MLTYDDFAILGNYLHTLSQQTYFILYSYIDRIKKLR